MMQENLQRKKVPDFINNGLHNQQLSTNSQILFLFIKDISLVYVKSTGKSALVLNNLQKT